MNVTDSQTDGLRQFVNKIGNTSYTTTKLHLLFMTSTFHNDLSSLTLK